jgi:hypothetical protein
MTAREIDIEWRKKKCLFMAEFLFCGEQGVFLVRPTESKNYFANG